MIGLFYLFCLGVGLLFGYLLAISSKKPKCKHNWTLIESGNIINYDKYGNKVVKGFMKVYECEHCLKMRKEQVELN